MARTYYKSFTVVGVADSEVLDSTGLESTKSEPKTIKAILISVSAFLGNTVRGYIEREKIFETYDHLLRTHLASGTNQYPVTNALIRIPLDHVIDEGDAFKIGVNSGGTGNTIFGSYEYEIGS